MDTRPSATGGLSAGGTEMPTADSSSRPGVLPVEVSAPIGPDEQPGARIGVYRLVQMVGEGGFGRVYLAEQEEPIRRRVALKVIKLGMDTRQVVARFEQERQALAVMDHPNIARVLDAGATASGRPYFVMEFCPGEPITSFCDRGNLTIRQRLELLVQICDAVQHAHQKGIIHRDIKPSNVLVSIVDGRAQAKVIDFGVAKATASRLTERTLFTEHRQLIGTPEYMSPEQAEGSLDIDTRTDVYALGVLLYELLTGSTPFDSRSLRSAAFGEIQRIIRETDPPSPSTRLSQNTQTLANVAARRQIEPRKLNSVLRGELDWIVMRALEKDRSRRYGTPSDLAADLRRHLGGQPVEAAPPSVGYRVRKFVRRNRGPVAAAGLVGVALIVGAAGTSVGFLRAASERDAARSAQADAEAVTEFLSTVLSSAAPGQMGRDVTVREVIDKASQTIGPAIEARPGVEARVRETLARTYIALGEYPQGDRNARRAQDLSQSALGPLDQRTLRIDALRGDALYRVGKFEEAEELLTRTVREASAAHGEDSTPAMEARTALATLYSDQARVEEAEKMFRTLVAGFSRKLGPDNEQTLGVINNLAVVLSDQGKFAEANKLFEETIQTTSQKFGPEHPTTLTAQANYGWSLQAEGRSKEAAELGAKVLEIRRRVLGPTHRETLQSENNLAVSYRSLERNDEAAELFERGLKVNREVQGSDHPDTLITVANLAKFYMETGKLERASELFVESESGFRRVMGDEFPLTSQTILGHGICLRLMGKHAEAITKLSEAYTLLSKAGGPAKSATRRAAQELSMAYGASGDAAKQAEWQETAKKLAPPAPAPAPSAAPADAPSSAPKP